MKKEFENQDSINELELTQKKLKKSKFKNILLSIFAIFSVIIFILEGIFAYSIFRLNKDIFDFNINGEKSYKSVTYDATPSAPQKNINMDAVIEKLEFIENLVNDSFYYDKDGSKVEEGIFAGYVAGLGDKYAEYFPKENYESFLETQNGEYYGIGAMVTQDYSTMQSTVTEIFSNSPAEKAGMQAGDVFLAIDGKDVTDMILNDIVSYVKGPEGSSVKITVFRPSKNENIDIVAIRGKVEINNVSTKTSDTVERLDANGNKEEVIEKNHIPNDLGYIKIKEFTGKTFEQFKTTLDSLERKRVKGLIIDLRDNPGGELDVVLNMIDYIMRDNDGKYTLNQKDDNFDVGKTLAVYMKDREHIIEAYYCDDGHEVNLPIAIIIDKSSASASELFTRCLMDYKKAVSVGTKSFGKGVVQNMIPLYDGSALKFTVSGYFPPSGYEIDGMGVIPDYPIDENGNELVYNENGISTIKEVATNSDASNKKSVIDINDFDDYQLRKAIEILE